MSVKEFRLLARQNINWTLPLKVEVYYRDFHILGDFLDAYFPGELADVKFIRLNQAPDMLREAILPEVSQLFEVLEHSTGTSHSPQDLNNSLTAIKENIDFRIIIFTDGVSDALSLTEGELTADLIFITVKDEYSVANLKAKDVLEEIVKRSNAAGAFAIAFTSVNNLGLFFDELFSDITKNITVVDSIRRLSNSHHIVYNPDLNWEQPITQALDHVIKTLEDWELIQYIQKNRIHHPLWGQRSVKKIYLQLRKIQQQLTDEHYNHIEFLEDLTQSIRQLLPSTTTLSLNLEIESEVDSDDEINFFDEDAMASEEDEITENGTDYEDAMHNLDEATLNETYPSASPVESSSKEEQQRYLQAVIFAASDDRMQLPKYLQPSSAYIARVNIGVPQFGYLRSEKPVSDNRLFIDTSTERELIVIHFLAGNCKAQKQTLTLPRFGKSDNIDFKFTTTSAQEVFRCDIIAVHKNRIIQWIALNAAVLENPPNNNYQIQVETVISTRQKLSNLANRQNFGGVLIIDEQDKDGTVQAILKDGPMAFHSGDGIRKRMDKIKGLIQSSALDKQTYPNDLANPKVVNILRNLAIHGEQLYQGFADGTDIVGPLQILAFRKEPIPANFVYSLPPPADDAPLCKHAVEALADGQCRECFDRYASSGSYICPFGFWGISKVIEYHTLDRSADHREMADFVFESEPSSDREVLTIMQNVIHGSSYRVDDLTAGTRQIIMDSLGSCSQLHNAENWTKWVSLTQDYQPDSIFLVVHTEKDDYDIDKMEIERDFLSQNRLSEQHIVKSKRPLVVVIGCSTANLNDQGFDIGSIFIRKGASIVISNFTKIISDDAAIIVNELIKILKETSGKNVLFGQIMLRLKQRLLAMGLIVGLSIITYGDADWQVILHQNKSEELQTQS